ncbi:HD domain-containing protein [Ramlibacter sp. PS4R-6]|uniref:HD domain-containing protein n=1 Tax=Ramlibacter sp. PS4R-6 TaxID=3133438 RepID=UPI0030B68D80
MIDCASWSKAWRALGAREGGESLHRKLVQCWSEDHRHYHTLQHLRECFELLTGIELTPEESAQVAIALWFHDAYYDPRRDDNERRSADWARREAIAAGVPQATAQRVHDMIMATVDHQPQADKAMQALVDIDLSILGAELARFDESDEQVRREYGHVPEAEWRVGRRRVLQNFLDRERLYGSDDFHSRFEERARENLKRSLARLGS